MDTFITLKETILGLFSIFLSIIASFSLVYKILTIFKSLTASLMISKQRKLTSQIKIIRRNLKIWQFSWYHLGINFFLVSFFDTFVVSWYFSWFGWFFFFFVLSINVRKLLFFGLNLPYAGFQQIVNIFLIQLSRQSSSDIHLSSHSQIKEKLYLRGHHLARGHYLSGKDI